MFELTVGTAGKTSHFTLTEDTLYVKRQNDKKWPEIQTPLRHVIWAELVDDELEVSLLARKNKKKKGSLALLHIGGKVGAGEGDSVSSFVKALMEVAYKGVKPRRNLKVLVNPHSGPGKSIAQLRKRVEPLFRAARCTVDITITTHSRHAAELMKDLPLGKYDAVVAMSGDGLIHEIISGFAEHKDPARAFHTPIAPIPTGSGNGLSLNLLGIEEGFDIYAAALNAAKGAPMSADAFSVLQQNNRIISFFTQTVGLMSELDLGTQNLRFMGDSRFIYGYVRGLVRNKPCRVKLSMKVIDSDKKKMVQDFKAACAQASLRTEWTADADVSPDSPSTSSALPPLKYSLEDPLDESWLAFDEPLLYVYAGKGPYVGRDLMQFPVSLPNDGCIDIVVQAMTTRRELLKALDDAPEKGQQYWMNSQHYFKAEAYRVEPYSSKSCLAIDGEEYPFKPFQVEVHKGLLTFLSPHGVYKADFDIPA